LSIFDFFKGRDQGPQIGIAVAIESDGFTVAKAGRTSPIRDGDVLLIAYKTGRSNWELREIEYRPTAGANKVFVYTGDQPTNVVVLSRKQVERAESACQVSALVYSSDAQIGTNYSSLDQLMDPLNTNSPLSPFSMWSPPNPIGFLELFSQKSSLPEDVSSIEKPFADQVFHTGQRIQSEAHSSADQQPDKQPAAWTMPNSTLNNAEESIGNHASQTESQEDGDPASEDSVSSEEAELSESGWGEATELSTSEESAAYK
jgi:hypothetical protein